MKRVLIVCILLLLAFILIGCKTNTVYVPIQSVKTEYKDRIERDSIYRHDSILIHTKGDTVFLERYKTLFRTKLVHDSVFKVDSIRVPYPIPEYKEVNRLTTFQGFQLWMGRFLLTLIIIWGLYKIIKTKFVGL